MSIAAGYIATILIAIIGWIISDEITELWDRAVIGAMRDRADVLFPERESVQADE